MPINPLAVDLAAALTESGCPACRGRRHEVSGLIDLMGFVLAEEAGSFTEDLRCRACGQWLGYPSLELAQFFVSLRAQPVETEVDDAAGR
jgi:hypothetical protein